MKKLLGSILLFSLLIILSGCSNNQMSDSSSGNSVKSSKEDCLKGCQVLWKSNQSNANKSEADMSKDCNSLCDAGQGIQNNDVDSCAKAEGIFKDTCFSGVAKNTNNPALCEKITSELFVSSCYIGIVENTGDKALCAKISDKTMKDVCLEK